MEAETIFIGLLVIVGMWRIEYDMVHWQLRDGFGVEVS